MIKPQLCVRKSYKVGTERKRFFEGIKHVAKASSVYSIVQAFQYTHLKSFLEPSLQKEIRVLLLLIKSVSKGIFCNKISKAQIHQIDLVWSLCIRINLYLNHIIFHTFHIILIMFGNSLTQHQNRRYCSRIQLGNTIKQKAPQLRSSIILGLPEETLHVYIQLSKSKTVQIKVSSLQTIGELQERIRVQFEVSCQYLMYQQKILNYNDKLSDCQIINGSILTIRQSFIVEINLIVKLYSSNIVIYQTSCNQLFAIEKIKEQIAKNHNIEAHSIRLFLGKDQISNHLSLADLGIYRDCLLLIKFSSIMGFINGSIVRLRNNINLKIQQVVKNSQISTYKVGLSHSNISEHCRYDTCQSRRIKNPAKLQLANGLVLQFTKGMYFCTPQGWRICSDQEKYSLQVGDKVMLSSKQFVEVTNIYYQYNTHQIDITCLMLESNKSFSVNSIIVSPAVSIQIIQGEGKNIFAVDLHESMTIMDLKIRIKKMKNISVQNQFLFIQNKQTILKDSLFIREIYEQNLTVHLSLLEINWKSKIQEQKLITFHFQDESRHFSVLNISQKTCQQVIKEYFKEKIQLNPYFGVLLNLKIIPINMKIEDIIDAHKQTFYYEAFQILAFKFPQKFIIRDLLLKFPSESRNLFLNLFKTTAQDLFLRNHELENTKEILLNLHKCSLNDQNKIQNYRYISELITILERKPNFIGKCYRAVLQMNPSKFEVGTIITIRQFLSCHTDKQVISNLLKPRNEIILHIKSVTGKELKDKEIVFLPYSYFIVQNKNQENNVTHVQLLEMPSPLTLSKNIILWVDDQPENNADYLQSKRINFKSTQIIQLTSTVMAKRWFHQFGWIVNRLNLKMRVISDMVRYEYIEGKKIINYEAGIDLIQYLFNDCGFTTPSLIFCHDASKGRENLARREIREDRFKQATNSIQKLFSYIDFAKNLSEWEKQ